MDTPIFLSTHMRIMDGFRYKLIDRHTSGRKRKALEGFNTYSYSRDLDKLVHHERSIDRKNDRYYEAVRDPDTGNILHCCGEKLSEHRGRGGAKTAT